MFSVHAGVWRTRDVYDQSYKAENILYMNACVRRGLGDDQYQEINAMSSISYIPPFARCQSMQTVLIPE